MNFAESVFVLSPEAPDADVRIRIFTPARELPFAGHPTLGSAFVLAGPLSKIVIRLETGAGVVPVELEREGPKIVFGRMEQPLPPWSPAENVEAILAAVGVERSGLPGRALRARPGPRLRRARLAGAGRRALARLRSDAARDRRRRQLLRPRRRPLEDADVRAEPRRRRGCRHRLGGRPARGAPRPPRPDRLRRADRDLAGRRDQPPVDALRAGRRHRGRARARHRRRLGRRRRPRRASAFPELQRSDLRQLGVERAPEAAAVAARRRGGCAPRRRSGRDRPGRSRPRAPPAGHGRSRATSRRRRARRGAVAWRRRPPRSSIPRLRRRRPAAG